VGFPIRAGGRGSVSYDEAGRIKTKSGAGSYDYQIVDVANPWQPSNAVGSIRNEAGVQRYLYDENGNLVKGPHVSYKYTPDNRLSEIDLDDKHSTRFDYGPSGDRYRKTEVVENHIQETIYLGSVEKISEFTTEEYAKHQANEVVFRYALSSPVGTFAMLDVSQTGPTPAAGSPVGPTGQTTERLWYLHTDQLGSVVRITDQRARLAARFAYDPWGKLISSAVLPAGKGLVQNGLRGFAGEEYLEEAGLVHMNGRVYDPNTGMFLSADPVALSTRDTQALNRFSYALNNPLVNSDPSGYFNILGAIGGAVVGFVTGGPAGAVAGAIIGGNDDVHRWVEQNWKTVVIVAAAVAVTAVTAGAAGPILAGMAAGAVSGGLSSALYGGNLGDVLTGAIRGAVIGGISAGAFYGVGEAFANGSGALNEIGSVAAHGTVGGAIESIQGGNFWTGFEAGSFTKLSSMYGPKFGSLEANIARAAVVGGTVAAMSGDNFANGAVLGAFSYPFNDWTHDVLSAASSAAATVQAGLANPSEYLGGVESAASMTGQFFTGEGPRDLVFGPESLESGMMASSPGVSRAVSDYYASGKTSGVYEFGATAVLAAGVNPIQQFVGSFSYSITPGTDGLHVTLQNYTSVHSLTYHIVPSWNRSTHPVMGTTHQTYELIVP
jgi:RHS repeat-associated protein